MCFFFLVIRLPSRSTRSNPLFPYPVLFRSFVDHSDISRRKVRVRWWDAGATTYRGAAFEPEAQYDLIPDLVLPARLGTHDDVPTFLGHYWLSGRPEIGRAHV